MKEEDRIREEEKLTNSSIADDPEALHDLSAAIESMLDLELGSASDSTDKACESGRTYGLKDGYESEEGFDESYESEEEEDFDEADEFYEEDDSGGEYGSEQEYDSAEDEEYGSDETDESDNLRSDQASEEDEKRKQAEIDRAEEEYLREKALKKRARKLRAYERRQERRAKRIERFWDFVDRRRKQIRWLFVGAFVLIVALIASVIAKNWKYHSVKELVVSEKEDTLSVSYANINGNVLKYGVDSAMLVDHNNDMLWMISYDMNSPKVTVRGEVFAIYDSKGTSVCICDETGQIGEVSTDMPIIKAEVARQGVVAAILEDGQNAWIKNYKKDGTEIATLKTTFTNPGYPMDLGLSEDGTLMAINYLYLDNGTPVSRVDFYNFGTVGQNQKDNLVAEIEYRDKILPEVEYLDEETCVAFREDGFSIYTGSQIPMESVKVDVDQSIVSTFFDSEYIGLVMQNRDSENDYLICLYNKKGKEVLRRETNFHYQTVELNGGQIVLASKDEFCVYSLQGVEKYKGDLEIPARVFLGFGRNKFIYVSEDTFRIVQIG